MKIKKFLSLLLLISQVLYIFAFALPSVSIATQNTRETVAPRIQVISCSGLVSIVVINTVDSFLALAELSGLIKTTHKKQTPKKESNKQEAPATLLNIVKPVTDFKTQLNSSTSYINTFTQQITNYTTLLSVSMLWLFLSGIFLSLYRMKINYIKVISTIDHLNIFAQAKKALI